MRSPGEECPLVSDNVRSVHKLFQNRFERQSIFINLPVRNAFFEAVNIVQPAQVLFTTPNPFKIGAKQNVDNVKVVTS